MALRTVRVEDGPLAELDICELGERSGLLWRSSAASLAGVGVHATVEIQRPDGGAEAQAALAEMGDAVAFAALPFDRAAPGKLIVPRVVVGEFGGVRWVTHDADSDTREAESTLAALLAESVPSGPARVTVRPSMSPDGWRDEVVGRALSELDVRHIRKVVMARELIVEADTPWSLSLLVRNLARRFPTANLFSVDGFIGASPELLVSRRERVVRAHPLAGTAARGETAEDDAVQVAELLASTKDQTEHRITIEWLLAELLPFCSYVDAEPNPSVVTMANVHHLATLVEGVLSEPAASVLDLVAAVHPTPAVGGDPQDEALELIDDIEKLERGRYAGPTGWVDSSGNGEFAVSVRSAQVDGATARVCAGVGVVPASDPEAELRETQTKFRAVMGALLG